MLLPSLLIFQHSSIPTFDGRDLAELYGVETKLLKQAVRRNIDRFPADFMFRLTKAEKQELVTNCDRLERLKHSSALPHVFTEQGVTMFTPLNAKPV